MGLFSKDIETMDDLFLHVVQDIYYAENQIVKSLPDMIEKATNRDLTTALKGHLAETEKQITRLEQVFELLGKDPTGTDCPAIDGILKEAEEIAGELRIRRCWMLRSSLRRKRSSIMRSRATGRWLRGRRSLIGPTSPSSCKRRSTRKKLPTRSLPALPRRRSTSRPQADPAGTNARRRGRAFSLRFRYLSSRCGDSARPNS